MDLTIAPLTPERWPALEDLFGPAGASNGCWCMYWRLGPAYARRERAQNRADFFARVAEGPATGLLAFDGDKAVGWCQLTPRAELPWLERRVLRHVDGLPAWSLSCFYVRRGYRRKGVAAQLISAALRAAKQRGAAALEAYPIDTAAPGSSSNIFTGTADMFEQAGFRAIGARSPSRPIMRHNLKGVALD